MRIHELLLLASRTPRTIGILAVGRVKFQSVAVAGVKGNLAVQLNIHFIPGLRPSSIVWKPISR